MSYERNILIQHQREALQRELIRAEGFANVASAVTRDQGREDIPNVLDYYRENAEAFNQPSAERGEVIFHREFDVALRFQKGIEITVFTNGETVKTKKYLGDLIAENKGRMLEIQAELRGEPIPKAP